MTSEILKACTSLPWSMIEGETLASQDSWQPTPLTQSAVRRTTLSLWGEGLGVRDSRGSR